MFLQDIIFAAILAFFLTWIIIAVSKVTRIVITRSTELGYRQSDIDAVLKRCYSLFPIDSLRFNGATYRRGMQIRVVTNKNKTIEGKFVGINNENVLCLLTPDSVIAHEIESIEEMMALEG